MVDEEALRLAIQDLGSQGGTIYLPEGTYSFEGISELPSAIRSTGAATMTIPPAKKERMIICFTGHRDCVTHQSELEAIRFKYKGAKWIHGGAIGFDEQVRKFIEWDGNIEHQVFKPNYAAYSSHYAPIQRNHRMVDQANLVVACWDHRIAGGTYDTIQYAHSNDVKVEYVTALQVALVRYDEPH